MKNTAKKIIIYGILLGLVLLLIQLVFRIDNDLFMKYYWIGAGIFLVLVVLLYVGYSIYISNKINAALPLFEEGRYPEYVQALEDLLAKTKGQDFKNMVALNLAAGYNENKDYQKSLTLLNQIDPDQLSPKDFKEIYWMNKSIAYFEAGDYESFKEIYRTQQDKFKAYKGGQSYHVDQLRVMDTIARGDFHAADQALEHLRDKWQGQYDEEMASIEDRIEKARASTN